MRIALVYDAIYPWVAGGAERRFREVGRRLAKRHEVHLVGWQWWDGPPTIECRGDDAARPRPRSCALRRGREAHGSRGGRLLRAPPAVPPPEPVRRHRLLGDSLPAALPRRARATDPRWAACRHLARVLGHATGTTTCRIVGAWLRLARAVESGGPAPGRLGRGRVRLHRARDGPWPTTHGWPWPATASTSKRSPPRSRCRMAPRSPSSAG